ncbi:MAG: hypothetical protein C5B59_07930 [Bacteroidetes bacterium]|nr:MAG: hypothetical protein C5B59_07930 [Bacteroidota bacterium]
MPEDSILAPEAPASAEPTLPESATPAAAPAAPATNDVPAEFRQRMAISLNGGLEPALTDTSPAEIVDDKKPAVHAPQPVAPQTGPPKPLGPNVTTPAPSPAVRDLPNLDMSFGVIKDKFGYQSAEDAIREIEQLRANRDNPVIPFENEDSEKLFRAFASGKKAEVLRYLEQEQRLESFATREVTPDSAADFVKEGIRLNNPTLNSAQVDYLFNKEFKVPSKPVQGGAENDDAFAARMDDYNAAVADRDMYLMIRAAQAKPQILAAKTTLKLPEVDQPVDENYRQYQQALAENEKIAQETNAAYKNLTPKSIVSRLNFKDPNNNLDFDFQFEPDPATFAQAMELTSDIEKFWSFFDGPDGKPDRRAFLHFVYNGINQGRMFREAMRQTVNAMIKASLPQGRQPLGRENASATTPATAPTEGKALLDKMMAASGVLR